MSVALRMARWNGEQIHTLYEHGAIERAWLCGTWFEDVKAVYRADATVVTDDSPDHTRVRWLAHPFPGARP